MKVFKAVTSGVRHSCLIQRNMLWKKKSFKQLTYGLHLNAGRNNHGKITVSHQCTGHKKKYRFVSFSRTLFGVPALVKTIEYDPNRTSFISLLFYKNGLFCYILTPHQLTIGNVLFAGTENIVKNFFINKIGYAGKLIQISIGTPIHNIEFQAGLGGIFARSAGTFCFILKKNSDGTVIIKLPSGEKKVVSQQCIATIGMVSNPEHRYVSIGKAGRNRWLGKRPSVRGIAMNPVDHPHGGRTNGGRPSVTPWARLTKGKPTRKKNKKRIIDLF